MAALALPLAESWFTARQVADGITLITEPHVHPLLRANLYHVRGTGADLVVDTGTGIAPLAWVLDRLTSAGKPVIAVATHTHYDHIGGMHEFGQRLVHAREEDALAGNGQFTSLFAKDFPVSWRSQVEDDDHPLPDLLVDAVPRPDYDPRHYAVKPATATRLVDEGDRISLGDRALTVMHTPGHSPGGITLFEPRSGVLFTGDTVYDSRLFDELPGSDIPSYVQSILRLRSLANVRLVCPGHDQCFDGARLRELCDAYLSRRR